jgi:hypothetical protein
VKPKDWGALLVSASTLLGALGVLFEKIHAADKDRAFAWDNYGDTVAEVEMLKARLAKVETACQVTK